MNYYTPIPGHFRLGFRKGQFSELLRYTSRIMDTDLWIDTVYDTVFFTGFNLHYLKPICESRGIVYLFTFTRLNAEECIRTQIPYKAFVLMIENYLYSIDYNIEVDARHIDNQCFNLYSGNDDD